MFILFPGYIFFNPIRTDTEENKTDYFQKGNRVHETLFFLISASSPEDNEEMSAEFQQNIGCKTRFLCSIKLLFNIAM